MTGPVLPAREAAAALLLLALLAAAFWRSPDGPGPGPLGLLAGAAAVHAALLAPALARERAWPLAPLLSLPLLAAASYGHPAAALAGAVMLVALAALAGLAAPSSGGLYLPTMTLVFALPLALGYLIREFGDSAEARAWEALSPLVAAGDGMSGGCVALLLVWPVVAVARSRRR